MSLTLELPESLSRELNEDAIREGVSAKDHATLLLYLAAALHDTGKIETPFQSAVQSFLASRSIDPIRLSTVLDDLVEQCLASTDEGKTEANLTFQGENVEISKILVNWKLDGVHHPTPMASNSEGDTATISEWPEGFFEETYGSLADDPLTRLPQGNYEERIPLQ